MTNERQPDDKKRFLELRQKAAQSISEMRPDNRFAIESLARELLLKGEEPESAIRKARKFYEVLNQEQK